MDSSVNTIGQWIPVVGTLLGAGIGFAASFINTNVSKAKDEKLSLENRDRDRIEKIYRLLVAINSEKAIEMSDTLNSIHHARPIKQKDLQAFPPLLELEMLINLYYPAIEVEREELMKAIHSFGEKYFEFGFKDYRNESLKIKQLDSSLLVKLHLSVDNK
jgi:hypothetical protein